MLVGLTYDLKEDYIKMGYSEDETAEFDRVDTIEAIEKTLLKLGYKSYRIGHVKNLISLLSKDEKWDIVFNIAEGLYGYGREAVIPAILETYKIPYTFSDPLALTTTLHKGIAKRIIRDIGLPTPDFYVVERIEDIEMISLKFPLFAKPVSEGTGKGINEKSRINNKVELIDRSMELLKLYNQPVLVETYLPGREFTVGIVGTNNDSEAIGVMEIILNEKAEKGVYSYINKEKCEELVEYKLITDEIGERAKKLALDVWHSLNLRDGGRVDLRCDAEENLYFLEVNPLAGLHPEHSDLPIICNKVNIPYIELIERIMNSAKKRIQ
jgi:D-alanine-D-alanine ligase